MKKNRTFIIAEIGNNHEGNFKNAKKMIFNAYRAGVDAVKFQTFVTDEFISKKKNKKAYLRFKRFELSFKEFSRLKDYSHKLNLKFISTPLDLKSADFLIKIADYIKIASGDNNFFPLIKKAIRSGKKLIISTGMMDNKNLIELNKNILKMAKKKNAFNKISLLHCVTDYPVENKFANLNSIRYLIKNFKYRIGYSDHTLGKEACFAAVALGSSIIEKHFTLDKKFSSFRDHSLSADFSEMKSIVQGIRKIEDQLGLINKKIQYCEKKNLTLARRGIYAVHKIKKGESLSFKNVKFLRPSLNKKYGILDQVFKKKAKKNFSKNKVVL